MLWRRSSKWDRNVLAEIPDVVVASEQSRFNSRRQTASSIEANRQAVLHPIRIGVDGLSGKIRGVVVYLAAILASPDAP